MQLWSQWWQWVAPLRAVCARNRTFVWMAVVLLGFCVRQDLWGVTNIVRALGLEAACYDRLLDFFHSPALNVDALTRLWCALVLNLHPGLLMCNDRYVLVGDGIKVAKAGKKMPAVKRLHQSSESNTKPSNAPSRPPGTAAKRSMRNGLSFFSRALSMLSNARQRPGLSTTGARRWPKRKLPSRNSRSCGAAWNIRTLPTWTAPPSSRPTVGRTSQGCSSRSAVRVLRFFARFRSRQKSHSLLQAENYGFSFASHSASSRRP